MNTSSRSGVAAVIRATSVSLATLIFLPGVFVRIGSQLVVANMAGLRITHRQLITDLGGEIEQDGIGRGWTKLLMATIAGPLLIGSVLLFPFVVSWTLLDVRPFAAVTVDPSSIVTHKTSLLPLFEAFYRFGAITFMRLWFAVSCFYCCVPSRNLIIGATTELHGGRQSRISRLVLAPILLACRALRALDSLLTFGFAGAYLASGLVMLFVGWRILGAIAHTIYH